MFSGGTLILTSSTLTPITTASVQTTAPVLPLGMPMLDLGWPASVDTGHKGALADLADQLPASLGDLSFMTMDWADADHLLDMQSAAAAGPDNAVAAAAAAAAAATATASHKDLLLDFSLPDSASAAAAAAAAAAADCGVASHVSEPNLSALSVPDLPTDPDISMDVSDWLDVIMPSTGLTPLSAPVCFPADPVLTPKPQDVLDLFNMDEDDLYTPTEVTFNFDKVMEVSTSNT